MLKKLCSCCNDKVIDYTDKYCTECAVIMDKHKKNTKRQYNKEIRYGIDKKYTDFYQSKEWKMCSKTVKGKYHGLCLRCLLKEDNINVYDVVHHILEIRTDEGWKHRYDIDGLIPLCHMHHNQLHSNYTQDKIDMLRALIKEYRKIYEE